MSCGSARVSTAPTQSDPNSPLTGFLDLRSTLKAGRLGDGGRVVCEALTSSLDGALEKLFSRAPSTSAVTLVALGGYGRAEMSLYSDVDLMVLHRGGEHSDVAAAVFRPLWDAGLRVGHSVRTVDEAYQTARQRFDSFTTLITSRYVAGSTELFDELMGGVAAVTRARPLRRYLVDAERERRAAAPYLTMSTDLKNGRGGLRTFQGFDWERRREALIGRFSSNRADREDEAYEDLLRIRNGLHAVTGRAHDVYSFELRQSVAAWLGDDVMGVGRSLVAAMRTADSLANRRWPELLDDSTSLVGRIRNRWSPAPAVVDGPPRAEELARILRAGESGRVAFEDLFDDGHLDEIVPEWETIRTLPHIAPFHEHPVDAHLWRTVDEMEALASDSSHFGPILTAVDAPDSLTLTAFLHDIGKGRGGDHSMIGAEIAQRVCDRLGTADGVRTLIVGGVEHHLLLAETATRRDIDDASVIADVAETLGSVRMLQVVYLLTAADSRATGSAMWSEWKATLVQTLYDRCLAYLQAERPGFAAPGTNRDEILQSVELEERGTIESHLAALADDYLRSVTVETARWHAGLVADLVGQSKLGFRPGGPADDVAVVGRSRPEFRQIVAEAFAANGIDVLEARLATRTDGIMVDMYRVRDDRTAASVSPERWGRAERDIEDALAGEVDTASKMTTRAEAYAATAAASRKPEVSISVDSSSDTGIITITCSDRIGRLAEILSVLGSCGLEITLAKLDSRGDELVDTFHVNAGDLPDDPEKLMSLWREIEASITH